LQTRKNHKINSPNSNFLLFSLFSLSCSRAGPSILNYGSLFIFNLKFHHEHSSTSFQLFYLFQYSFFCISKL
jgi:hypothetical protein